MNIKNKDLSTFIDNVNDGTLTMDNIQEFGNEISTSGLNEFLELLSEQKVDLFALKVYTTIYDKEKIKSLESLKEKTYIDAMFAAMWQEDGKESTSQELSEAMLGFVFFGSDLISRIRNGYEILKYPTVELNKQVHDFINYFSNSIEENTFFRDLSQVETEHNDSEIFNTNSSDLDSIKKIRDIVELSKIIIDNKESVKSDFLNKYSNIKLEDLSFLDNRDLYILKNLKKDDVVEVTEDNKLNITNDFKQFEPLASPLSIDDSLSTEEHISDDVSSDKSLFSSINIFSKNTNNKVSDNTEKTSKKPVRIRTLRRKSSKGSSLKITVVLFLLITISGVGFVAINQQSKTTDGESNVDKIVEDSVVDKNFSITRNGTNKEGI